MGLPSLSQIAWAYIIALTPELAGKDALHLFQPPRADQMPGPPREGQLIHEFSLDWQHHVYCSTKQSILIFLFF